MPENITLDANLYLAKILISYCTGKIPDDEEFRKLNDATVDVLIEDKTIMPLIARFANIVTVRSYKPFYELSVERKEEIIDHIIETYDKVIDKINKPFFKGYFRMISGIYGNDDWINEEKIKELINIDASDIVDKTYEKDVVSRYLNYIMMSPESELEDLIKMTERLEALNKQ